MLREEYRRIERELLKIASKLDDLEEEGLYGSKQYDALVEKQTHLEDELEGIEQEMDR